MAKQKFRITNWRTYNQALINRGSLTFWLDESVIHAWYDEPKTTSRGRPQRYSALAISTVLMLKRVFRLTLRAAQGFIDSIFTLMKLPLRCPDYSCVSRRAQSVCTPFKKPTRGEVAHLVIDSTGLKVFGEGEWKVKKHGQEKCRVWRKRHLAVDADTRPQFYCTGCQQGFNLLANTPLRKHYHMPLWSSYVDCLVRGDTITPTGGADAVTQSLAR